MRSAKARANACKPAFGVGRPSGVSLLAWLPGYFINPSYFWIAYQFIGTRIPTFE